LLGQFQQPDLGSDDLLLLRHRGLLTPKGGPRSRLFVRTASRPPAPASENQLHCLIKSELTHVTGASRCPHPTRLLAPTCWRKRKPPQVDGAAGIVSNAPTAHSRISG